MFCGCTWSLLQLFGTFTNSLSWALLRDSSPVTWWQASTTPYEPSILGLQLRLRLHLHIHQCMWPLTGPGISFWPWTLYDLDDSCILSSLAISMRCSPTLSGPQLCVPILRKHLPEYFSSVMLVPSYCPLIFSTPEDQHWFSQEGKCFAVVVLVPS